MRKTFTLEEKQAYTQKLITDRKRVNSAYAIAQMATDTVGGLERANEVKLQYDQGLITADEAVSSF